VPFNDTRLLARRQAYKSKQEYLAQGPVSRGSSLFFQFSKQQLNT